MVVLSVFEMTYRIESVRLSHKMQQELKVEKQNYRCNKKHIAKTFHHHYLKKYYSPAIQKHAGSLFAHKKNKQRATQIVLAIRKFA